MRERAASAGHEAVDYVRPGMLGDALEALARGRWAVLAGGTDFYPMQGEAVPSLPILDISAIGELRGIREWEEEWRIGALTSWSEIAGMEMPPAFDGLRLAAREVGSIQIQNRATVAGNLCNASPAADGVPPLLCLDAMVELRSRRDVRRLPLDRFLKGYRKTARRPDELVTAVFVPKGASRGRSAFRKLGARKYLVISIAMVAARLEFDDAGRIIAARLAVGACSPVARRLPELEQALIGCDRARGFAGIVAAADLSPLTPIDDVRAPAAYRRDAARELILRTLEQAAA